MELHNPHYYFNREQSWLEFNLRVLEEAQDKTNPILERIKFLAITASNLDEFYMVRVSNLMELDWAGASVKDHAGLSVKEQLAVISKMAHEMYAQLYSCLNRSILPGLEKENLSFLDFDQLDEEQSAFVENYFTSTVYPILTPMAIDQSRPFPLLNNKSLNLIIELKNRESEAENALAVMQVPTVIPRILSLPSTPGGRRFIMLEDIIKAYADRLFTGHTILSLALFRITRNSDLEIDEEDAEDLLNEIEQSIKQRKWGDPVRLEIEKTMAKSSRLFLMKQFELDENDIFEVGGILDLTVWMGFSSLPGYDFLRNPPLPPQPSPAFIDRDIFSAIRAGDILVHHPYESFDCVVDFVRLAAADPNVLAIKQTLYRVSGQSPIVNALIAAAENGKQVTVMVELKARFDEENNINWAKKLEKSGCHVVYGLVGLKTHCKTCLVVRKEDDGIRRYVHLGTGNYNDNTAKIYTDLGYFTCKETFAQDVSALFNLITGYSDNKNWNKLSVAPLSLRETFLRYIKNEEKNALDGKDAGIVAKMNSLVDMEIIQALYKASMAGVRIKLLVRGICCLRSGVPGVSDNIIVTSIVDRFLEHSRIYYFENAGNPKIFLSSACWMPRNLDHRVEVAFPIEKKELKKRLIEILDLSLSDTIKLRIQKPNGTYEKVDRRGKEHIQSQLIFYNMARQAAEDAQGAENSQLFKPIYKEDEDGETEGL